jgi:uncharacterized membrane protein
MKSKADERLDRVVGIVLRTGVTLAATVVLIGGVAWLAGHNQVIPDRHKFHPAGRFAELGGIVHGVFGLEPLYLIQLGLLILIATPVLRVLVCAIGFAAERDWTYAVISTIVLALLVFSIAGSGI